MSLCYSFSTQALQGSQGKTEAKIQDIKYPMGGAGLVFPNPSDPTGLNTSCNNYNPPRTEGRCKYKKFNSYLAGLFEGDGHIWLPNINWNKTNKHNPRFCITFALKNEPLAKKILEIIEYGHIRYKPKENACVLIVSTVKGLKKII